MAFWLERTAEVFECSERSKIWKKASFPPDGALEPGKVNILVPIIRGPMVFVLNPAVIAIVP
jgi:hypothetical protein